MSWKLLSIVAVSSRRGATHCCILISRSFLCLWSHQPTCCDAQLNLMTGHMACMKIFRLNPSAESVVLLLPLYVKMWLWWGNPHLSITGQSDWTVFTVSEMHNTVIKSQDLTSPLFLFFLPICLCALRFPCVGGPSAGLRGWESPMIYGSIAGLTAPHLTADGAGGNERRFLRSSPHCLAKSNFAHLGFKAISPIETQRFNWGRDLFEHFYV